LLRRDVAASQWLVVFYCVAGRESSCPSWSAVVLLLAAAPCAFRRALPKRKVTVRYPPCAPYFLPKCTATGDLFHAAPTFARSIRAASPALGFLRCSSGLATRFEPVAHASPLTGGRGQRRGGRRKARLGRPAAQATFAHFVTAWWHRRAQALTWVLAVLVFNSGLRFKGRAGYQASVQCLRYWPTWVVASQLLWVDYLVGAVYYVLRIIHAHIRGRHFFPSTPCFF
jgi:hypothetical protein